MTAKSRQISPSMMCADFLHLADELDVFARAGVEWLHIDVMDGRYVPNFTLGVDFCRALVQASDIPLDVHLMVEEPHRHVDPFLDLPKKPRLTFHPETLRQPVRLIDHIRERGGQAGIALDPSMPLESVRHLLPLVDQVLVMTVNPGYAGQKLLPFCMEKLAAARRWLDEHGLEADLEVDGNVSWENIPKMAKAGANIFVAGTSSIFTRTVPRAEALARLRDLLGRCSD